VPGEPRPGVARRQAGRHVGPQPLLRFGAEGGLRVGVGQVDHLPNSSRTLSATPDRLSSNVKPCSNR
jgi:hypothetical protein